MASFFFGSSSSSSSSSDEVILMIYDLLPPPPPTEPQPQPQPGGLSAGSAPPPHLPPVSSGISSLLSFLSTNILSPLGLGTFHTSIVVNGYVYAFGAALNGGGGIWRSSAPNEDHVPPSGRFKQSISLGSCTLGQSRINDVVKRLRDDSLFGDTYHLTNRNCNHFTEVFSTALLATDDELMDPAFAGTVAAYPTWVNRLAKTANGVLRSATAAAGGGGGGGGDAAGQMVVCEPAKEARKARGVAVRDAGTAAVGCGSTSSSSSSSSASAAAGKGNPDTAKKTLTEEQKKKLEAMKSKMNAAKKS